MQTLPSNTNTPYLLYSLYKNHHLKKQDLCYCLSLFIPILLLWPLSSLANNTDEAGITEFRIQPLFSAQQADAYSSDSREPLRRIILDNIAAFMTQDGDIYEEDVATLELPVLHGALQQRYSFTRSKYQLAKDVYDDYKIAFYSRCRFRTYQKKLVPVKSSCTYQPRKSVTRGGRIEWEHVVPAWVFGHQLQCWQNGGRAHCRSTHNRFRQMEADMHNLVPAIGEINGDRSNYRFQMIPGEARAYGRDINMEIDFRARHAEPPDEVYGDIARTYLYMRERYGFRLSKAQHNLMIAWNNLDPVDEWEKKRNQKITQIQGNHNPFVSHYRHLEATDSNESSSSSGAGNNTSSSDDPLEQWLQEVIAKQEEFPYYVGLLAAAAFFVYRWYKQRKQNRSS